MRTILLFSLLSLTACGDKGDTGGGGDGGGGDGGGGDGGGGDGGGGDGGGGDGGGGDGGGGDGGTGSTARTGLEGFCDYYVECGGTYYSDAQACIDATLGYWDECRQAELDAFGDCMMAKVDCEDWNPDAYNPASTPCADEWAAVTGKDC